ncbi:MAG: CD225/dispanin family protein, partial [Paramuribaculum sp.]|nr:CD225/dispanin family protein [Paramuribaculum sp.]
MTYYVATPTGQHEGPFTVEELVNRGITPDTLVYNSSLSGWTKASMVPEIANHLSGVHAQPAFAPGYQQFAPANVPAVAPKTWLAESILVTLFCCLPFGIVGIVKASSVDSLYRAGDYEGAQMASQAAGKWTKIGFFCGLAVVGIYLLIGLGAGFSALYE